MASHTNNRYLFLNWCRYSLLSRHLRFCIVVIGFRPCLGISGIR
ncbi:hypothetical protein FEZ18_09075 [Oceanihabitans sp. IOP_32]|nr:hypothetical protein FEZ18_09075 [Oceanihabitans sp. IOP_32]